MDNSAKDRSLLACGMVLFQCALYGLGDPLAKLAYTHVPVYAFLSFRYLLALAVMWLLFGKRLVQNLHTCRVSLVILPCICVAGSHLLSNMALQYTTATAVGFLRSLSVILVPLLALVAFKRRISLPEILVIILAVCGLYLLCGMNGLAGFGAGELLALGCALFSAVGVLSLRYSLKKTEPLVMTMYQTLASFLVALAGALLSGEGLQMKGADVSVWMAMAYLAIGCTFGGYMLQNRALQMIPAKTVSLLMCFCSVMTAFFSWLILHERLSPAGMVGAGMILAGVAAETMLSGRESTEKNENQK